MARLKGITMKCECSGKMVVSKVKIAPALFSFGYKCRKCNKVEFNEEQMRKALGLKESAII